MEDNTTNVVKNEITVVKKAPTQKTVNSILITAAAVIFVVVILSYFVEDLNIFANLTLKEVTSGALWVCIGCFSISEIIKQVAINRAKLTEEYKKAKEETDKELTHYSDMGALKYADEYCREYERSLLKDNRIRLLSPVGIDYKEFEDKYLAKSFWYIRKKHKQLSVKQIIAIWKANRAKQVSYNPDFLRTTVKTRKNISPSDAYNAERKNAQKTALSFVTSIGGGLFAFTIARDLVVSFSVETMIEAAIKVAMIIMSSAFQASFGWSLIMDTEINRLNLQREECKACIRWSKERYPNQTIKE
jgi:hypothetical protein